MKKLLLLFGLFCLAFLVKAQEMPVDKETGKITFSEVVTIDSASKSNIYLQANEWFARTFKDANSVLQLQDKDQGIIIGKGWNDIYIGNTPKKLWYLIKIEAKENRYRYEITDIILQDYPSQYNQYSNGMAPIEPIVVTYLNDKKGRPRKLNLEIKNETIKAVNNLTASIKKDIKQKKKTEW